jgi:hypothetical protein
MDAGMLLSRADATLDALKTYQVRMTRVERVGGQLQPEEEILLSVRRDPKAVRLEWTTGQNQGREVIYSSVLDPASLYIHMASSALPLPAIKIPINSPLVTKNSRHSITEAGFETILANLRGSQQRPAPERPHPGKLEYKGLETPTGFDQSCHKFVRQDSKGDSWTVFLDPHSLLPCLVVAKDAAGQLIEREVYHGVQANPAALASSGAFEPDKRWGDAKGLLSRLARAAGGSDPPASSQSITR